MRVSTAASEGLVRHFILVVSVIGLAVAVAAFLNSRAFRDSINTSLASEQLTTPERRFSYGAGDLQRVAEHLKSQRSGDHRTLLDLYIHDVLISNDIIFAVALSIFSAALWIWIMLHFELAGWPRNLVIAAAVSAILYGIFDVAEDVTLARLLGKSDTISKDEGAIACQLTQLKMITLVGSVTGVAAFETLSYLTAQQAERSTANPSGAHGSRLCGAA
jgi:hypothetical protein